MLPTTTPLIEQSLWWLAPYAGLLLVMLYAMMEFTVTLLLRPPANRKPVAGTELRRRLLALNKLDQPHPLAVGQDCDLEIRWRHENVQYSRFALSRHANSSHIRFLLDEQRHELRMNQVDRGWSFFLGLDGWLPYLSGYASLGAGPPGQFLTKDISHMAYRCGWKVRPVLWWFQATHSGARVLQALTPTPLRCWSARRFWGGLYPLSYFLGIGYLVVITGTPDRHALFILIGVSAGWWGLWGFLVWVLRGFPAFWRRQRRKR
jgi:hypothetical protein